MGRKKESRSKWTKPMVLLGSAGLHMACVWDIKGATPHGAVAGGCQGV